MGWRFKVTVIAILLAIGIFSTTVYVLGQLVQFPSTSRARASIPPPFARGSTLREQELLVPAEFFQSPQLIAACDAISAGDQDRLQELIATGLDVNAASRHGVTLLHWAIICKNLPAFRQLLAAGADPDVKLADSRLLAIQRFEVFNAPLLFGLLLCDLPARWEFFFAALDHTRDPQQRHKGFTLLHLSVNGHNALKLRAADLQRLLAAKLDLDAKDPQGDTAAINALAWDRPQHCLMILKAGANPDIRDNRGESVADILAKSFNRSQTRPDRFNVGPHHEELKAWLNARGAESDVKNPQPAANAP